MHLIRGAFAVEAGRMKDVQDVLGTGVSLDGLDCRGDTYSQHAARMEGMTHLRVADAQVTCHRVHLARRPCPDALVGLLDFVDQRQHRAGVARIALGYKGSEEKTGRGFRDDAGLSATLRRAIALAFEQRGNGGIRGIDQFAVAALLALGQLGGVCPDVGMVAHRCGERQEETLALGLPQGKELLFGLTHQGHAHASLPSTAAAKTPHDLCEGVLQVLGVAVELGGPAAALLRDGVDELTRFF